MRNTLILVVIQHILSMPLCVTSQCVQEVGRSMRSLEGNVEGVEREAILNADGVVVSVRRPACRGRPADPACCDGQGERLVAELSTENCSFILLSMKKETKVQTKRKLAKKHEC